MQKKVSIKIFSVVMAFFMLLSVISFPKITAKADGVDDFIGRCYQVTLGRDADSDGYAYWRDILVNRKQDGSVVAHGFLFSPEYIDKKTSDEQYIKDLYMLFMGREPEQSGYDYWCEKMANGEDREKIFAGFANSEEYFKLCNGYGITAGYYSADYDIQQINGVNLFVERMYQNSLDRLGDQGGQNDWVQALLEGRISGIECARCFIQSPEFKSKDLSDEEYIKILYRVFMGREYDWNGYYYWLTNIRYGYTRGEVFAGFANSPEFEEICNFYGIIRGDYKPIDYSELEIYGPDGESICVSDFNEDAVVLIYGRESCYNCKVTIKSASQLVKAGKSVKVVFLKVDNSNFHSNYTWYDFCNDYEDCVLMTNYNPDDNNRQSHRISSQNGITYNVTPFVAILGKKREFIDGYSGINENKLYEAVGKVTQTY